MLLLVALVGAIIVARPDVADDEEVAEMVEAAPVVMETAEIESVEAAGAEAIPGGH